MTLSERSRVLVINSGSSSIKYQLVEPSTGVVVAKGLIEQVGEPEGHAHHYYGDKEADIRRHISDHVDGMKVFQDMFDKVGPSITDAHIIGVGHRVVQGGNYFDGPVEITPEVYHRIEDLCSLAPLHNPANLKGIDEAKKILPDIPHVAAFDTAFFQHLPLEASTYALEAKVAKKYQIRRYGAHGTSHQFVSEGVSQLLGRKDLRQIVLHLGNGASASAVVNGKAVETSMGLTPLEGLVMGTRTGDIDPAAVFHILRNSNMSVEEVDTLFNKQSGVKGLCGVNDMRHVQERADNGDPQAQLALDVYEHRVVKYVGAYIAVMGGLDALTFTAGVGENDPEFRQQICDRLAYMNIHLNNEINTHGKGPRIISEPDSGVTVIVFPTNEELAIARQVVEVVHHA